jgi:hypothetical protein
VWREVVISACVDAQHSVWRFHGCCGWRVRTPD